MKINSEMSLKKHRWNGTFESAFEGERDEKVRKMTTQPLCRWQKEGRIWLFLLFPSKLF